VLAVEVLSLESEERDREDKPFIYAAMGIPAYWLVERGKDDVPIVHEYHFVGGEYRLVRTHIDRLTTDTPFPIDIILKSPIAGLPPWVFRCCPSHRLTVGR
jgi:Uma2 family endonuclease